MAKRKSRKSPRRLDARPDTLDFRDHMYEPTLIEVPTERPLSDYQKTRVPILDQGREGACTGFGLATVIHYLLRSRRVVPDRGEVSPWMLYDMVWTFDRSTNKMVKYDQQGKLLYAWGTMGSFPGGLWGVHGISVDSDGNLYVAEVDSGRVQKFKPRPGANPAYLVAKPVKPVWANATN